MSGTFISGAASLTTEQSSLWFGHRWIGQTPDPPGTGTGIRPHAAITLAVTDDGAPGLVLQASCFEKPRKARLGVFGERVNDLDPAEEPTILHVFANECGAAVRRAVAQIIASQNKSRCSPTASVASTSTPSSAETIWNTSSQLRTKALASEGFSRLFRVVA